MIGIRSLVKFVSKNRDDGVYIVREVRYNQKLLIECLKDKSYYIIDIYDVEEIEDGEVREKVVQN